MKFFNNIKRSLLVLLFLGATAFISGAVYAAIAPGSVKYEGPDTPALSEPALNAYYDVPSVGNEADFVRVKADSESNSQYRNAVNTTCKTGDKFDIWVYAHNGASVSGNDNGSGPSVAKDVIARVDLNNGEQKSSFDIKGFLSSSNAGNINDGAVINCGEKKFKLSYVENSAKAFLDLPNTNVNLPSSIITNGTPIGTNGLDGNLWGCWDQRVWMGLEVIVEEIEEPKKIVLCEDLITSKYLVRPEEEVNFTVNATASNATINGYIFRVNGETVQNSASNKYTFSSNEKGQYEIKAVVKSSEGNVTSPKCVKTVEVDEEDKPIYKCDKFVLSRQKAVINQTIKSTASVTALNGAEFKHATFTFGDENDNGDKQVTNNIKDGVVTANHSYAKAGSYNQNVVITFTVNGEMVDVADPSCSDSVKVTETPMCEVDGKEHLPVGHKDCKETVKGVAKTLPKTGAGGVAGLFAALTAAGTVTHRKLTLRRK